MSEVVARDVTGGATKESPEVINPRQPDKVEATPQEVEKVLDTKEDALSPKFAALARKEKAIRERTRALEAERAQLKSQMEEVESFRGWKTKIKADPLSALTEAGISYDDLTNALLNQGKPEDLQFKKLQAEIESLKNAQERQQSDAKKAQDEQYQRAKKQISTEVSLLVDGDEAFETIKSMQAQDSVVELIETTFKEDGVLMSVEDAAKEVEEYLMEQALTMARLKKVQSKLAPTPPAEVEQKQPHTQQKQQLNTLSNRIPVSTGKGPSARERAIAAFQGKQIT